MSMPRAVAAALAFLLAGCISSNPPAPPVRWFDPTPDELPPLPQPGPALPVATVSVAASVRQEFVLRTAARELVIDDLHQWSAPPDRLVAAAVEAASFGPGGGTPSSERFPLRVARFEFELYGAAPRAVVELQAMLPQGLRRCRGASDAAGLDPGELAAAMAQALGQAVAAVRAALVAP